jgi:hypothetical protein
MWTGITWPRTGSQINPGFHKWWRNSLPAERLIASEGLSTMELVMQAKYAYFPCVTGITLYQTMYLCRYKLTEV